MYSCCLGNFILKAQNVSRNLFGSGVGTKKRFFSGRTGKAGSLNRRM